MRDFIAYARPIFIVGASSAIAVAIVYFFDIGGDQVAQDVWAAVFGIGVIPVASFIAWQTRRRYKLHSNTFSSVFHTKMKADINRFTDSNTAMTDALFRMSWDLRKAVEAAEWDDNLREEASEIHSVRAWIEDLDSPEVSFATLVSNNKHEEVFRDLINTFNKVVGGNKLTINTSVAEPGCVALVELLKKFGLNVEHQFEDINGIVQAGSLASGTQIDMSFVPISTVALCSERSKILKKYSFGCPITSEDQQIIASRDSVGRYSYDDITIVRRGSGHFQWLNMTASGNIPTGLGNFIGLSDVANGAGVSVLYEPVASINLESSKTTALCGFVTDLPHPVDIVLILDRERFAGDARNAALDLIVYAMWYLKSQLNEKQKIPLAIYRMRGVKKAFIAANAPFSDILE